MPVISDRQLNRCRIKNITPRDQKDRDVESLLWEALTKIAPHKYRRASILTRVDWNCSHMKGGKHRVHDDYNLGQHTMINGETVIWCLYGCGLRVSSLDPDMKEEFQELTFVMKHKSTNTPSASQQVAPKPDNSDTFTATFFDVIQSKPFDPLNSPNSPLTPRREALESEMEKADPAAGVEAAIISVRNREIRESNLNKSLKAAIERKTQSRRKKRTRK